MNEIPFIAFGNDELDGKEEIGNTIICERCGETHEVRYGNEVLEDGTKVPSKMLAFVDCGDSTYLVGLDGKRI